MKLNESQIKRLTSICEWILDYAEDYNLPNSDGSATDEVVINAHNLTGLIVKHNINAIKNKETLDEHDYCDGCDTILNYNEGDLCCWCEQRAKDEEES